MEQSIDISALVKSIVTELKEADKETKRNIVHKHRTTISDVLQHPDVFNQNKAKLLCALAKSESEMVYEQFNHFFNSEYKFREEIFNSENYREVLQALYELACDTSYFENSASHLLTLAASEPKAGIYHGKYIAFPYLFKLIY